MYCSLYVVLDYNYCILYIATCEWSLALCCLINWLIDFSIGNGRPAQGTGTVPIVSAHFSSLLALPSRADDGAALSPSRTTFDLGPKPCEFLACTRTKQSTTAAAVVLTTSMCVCVARPTDLICQRSTGSVPSHEYSTTYSAHPITYYIPADLRYTVGTRRWLFDCGGVSLLLHLHHLFAQKKFNAGHRGCLLNDTNKCLTACLHVSISIRSHYLRHHVLRLHEFFCNWLRVAAPLTAIQYDSFMYLRFCGWRWRHVFT